MILPLVLVPFVASLTAGPSQGRLHGHDCKLGGDQEPASLLRLVNKSEDTALDPEWEPDDMVELSRSYMVPGARGSLRAEAARALGHMIHAGKAKGHEIRVRSAFRSYKKQGRIFKNKSRRYGLERASRVSARAGHSQHQLGTTVDIVLPRYRNRITQRIAQSPEHRWLRQNAHRFGYALSYPRGEEELTGYMYEPWHYRYLGVAAATGMWKRKLPMESYLRICHLAR
jgi:D-alanyl-D-alanine carboxypeptidase